MDREKLFRGSLDNEKYCGNVIVVKTYEISTPEKKRVRNRGERKKYYAVGTHPAIITQEQFETVQVERKARTNVEMTESGMKRKSTRYSSKQRKAVSIGTAFSF